MWDFLSTSQVTKTMTEYLSLMKMSVWSTQSFKLIATIRLHDLPLVPLESESTSRGHAKASPQSRKYGRHGHNYGALCRLLFVSRSVPTLNFKCECDYRVAFIFNGLCLYVF